MTVTAAHLKKALSAVPGALGRQMRSLDELAAGADAALRQAPKGLTAQGAAAFLATMAQESWWFRVTEELAKNGRYAPYIGRTFEQITWKDNYRAFGKWCKAKGLIDDAEAFVKDWKSLADYRWAWLGGVWFFEANKLWAYANAGDFLAVQRGVNLGNPRSKYTPAGMKTRRAAYDAFLSVGAALLPAAAAQVPSTPAPPVEPALPPVAVPSIKPAAGSSTAWVRVDARGKLVPGTKGFWVTTRALAMHLEACRLFRALGGGTPPEITQGGRNAGGVKASAGTHDREALDWATKNFSAKRARLWELCCWTVGFASWIRFYIKNLWPAHTHGIPKGGDLSRGADDQEGYFARSIDGLKSKRRYPRIAALGVQKRTWEDYLARFGVSLSGLQEAFAKRTTTNDVRELQLLLSGRTGTDLAIDGDPGPQTAKALASVGSLDALTLAGLGLEVRP